MGGSGGGGTFYSRTPDEARRQVRDAEDRTTVAAFESTLSKTLGDLLGNYNSRDHNLVEGRLVDLKDALGSEIEGTLDQLFGGSVARSYVDGLSDIDSLVFVNDTSLEGKKPQTVLAKMEKILKKELGNRSRGFSRKNGRNGDIQRWDGDSTAPRAEDGWRACACTVVKDGKMVEDQSRNVSGGANETQHRVWRKAGTDYQTRQGDRWSTAGGTTSQWISHGKLGNFSL